MNKYEYSIRNIFGQDFIQNEKRKAEQAIYAYTHLFIYSPLLGQGSREFTRSKVKREKEGSIEKGSLQLGSLKSAATIKW